MKLKIFGKNAIIYSMGSLALRASAFLLIPLYTHYLSLNDFGILSILLLTIQILVTLIDFGIINSLMRFLPEYEFSGKLYKLLGTSLTLNIFSSIFFGITGYIVLSIVSPTVIKSNNAQLYIILTIIAAITQSLCVNMMSYYRAKNLGFKYTIISLIITILLITFSALLLIVLNTGITGILVGQIISYGAVWLFITTIIYFKERFGFSSEIFKKLTVYGYPLIFARSGDLLMLTLSTYFLSYFSSTEDVGIYSLAYRIASIAGIILTMPFQLAFEPYIFANINTEGIKKVISSLTTYLILAMAFTSFIIVFVFKDFISIIAPPEYGTAYAIIFFLLPGLSLSGIHTIAQTLLHINNKTKTTGIVVGSLSFISTILSYFLIPKLSIIGIVISFNFFQLSVATLSLFFGNKSFPITFELKRITISLCIYFLVMLSVFLSKDLNSLYFYPANIALITLVIFVLFNIDFFSKEEKNKLYGLIGQYHNKIHNSLRRN